jgi:hypothetical protein
MTDAKTFLMGGGQSASFSEHGDRVVGVITKDPDVVQTKDFKTGKPEFYDDGNPKEQLVITLKTQDHDPDDETDDGTRRVYVKGKNIRNAIRSAVRNAGADGLAIGGILDITYTGDGEPAGKGLSAPKEYAAKYYKPSAKETPVPEDKPKTAAKSVAGPEDLTPEAFAQLQALADAQK